MLRVLEGHTDTVRAVALSADGRRAVSGSSDKTVRVWDLEGDQPPRVLEGHTGAVKAVALLADGKRAISGSDDKTIRVWDLEGGVPPRVLEGHTNQVNAVAISANGKRAISGSGSFVSSIDNSVRIWDLEGDQPPHVLKGHTGPVKAVALSADGKRAVSGSNDKTLRVWDLEGNQPSRVLEGHTSLVVAVAMSGDGKRAVSGSQDGTVLVWDLEGNRPPRVLEGHRDRVSAVALSADGKRAVSGSGDHDPAGLGSGVWQAAWRCSPAMLQSVAAPGAGSGLWLETRSAMSIFSPGRSEGPRRASGRPRASRPEPFSETLERERETVHGQLVQGLQKANPELPSALAGNEWFARLEIPWGIVGRLEVHQKAPPGKETRSQSQERGGAGAGIREILFPDTGVIIPCSECCMISLIYAGTLLDSVL